MVANLRADARVEATDQVNAEARWARNLQTFNSNKNDDRPTLATFRAPEWNRQILLKVRKCEILQRPRGEAVIEVDWGPYFDFKDTRAVEPEGAADVYLNAVNLRYRRYVGVRGTK